MSENEQDPKVHQRIKSQFGDDLEKALNSVAEKTGLPTTSFEIIEKNKVWQFVERTDNHSGLLKKRRAVIAKRKPVI